MKITPHHAAPRATPPLRLAPRPEPHTSLVTGATAGIGRAIARGLAAHGSRVVLASRDRARGLEAADDIARATGAEVELLEVDLAEQRSIRRAAAEALERFGRIDVLVNDAAVWSVRRAETAEGIERTWAVNVLGYFLLTHLLTERLVASAPARVVNVASGLAHSLDLDDVELRRRSYRGVTAYAQSKQANRMLTRAFARRLTARGVTVSAMHPGFTRTEAFAKGGGVQGALAGLGARLFGKPPERGADTAIWLATAPELAGIGGGYFEDRCERACEHTDEAAEEALYALCERMTGVA